MRSVIELHPSGDFFNFDCPSALNIHIDDIALSLSQQCRFGSFTRQWYSVADHALLVHRLVRNVADAELAFAALHHDSHEAYLGDIPTPLKRKLGDVYTDMAWSIDTVLAVKFDVPAHLFTHDIVKAADEQALFIEAAVLKKSCGIGPHWGHDRTKPPAVPTGAVKLRSPQESEALFLIAHRKAYAAMLASRG